MIRIIRNSNQYHYLVNKYLLDSATEIEDLPTTSISPGSEAIINNTNTKYRLNNDFEWKLVQDGGGGGGAVESVNGKIGAVVLTAADVGALPEGTPIFSGDYNDLTNKPKLKTINGESVLGEGNVAVKTYQAMPQEWLDAPNFQEFVNAIFNDTSAVPGMAYLGTVGFDGIPPALGAAECIVDIISGDEYDKIALIKLNSSDVPPYNWEYNTWTEDFTWRELWSVPKAPDYDGQFKLHMSVEDGWPGMPEWVEEADLSWIPELPEEDGSYVLKLDRVEGEIDARWARND